MKIKNFALLLSFVLISGLPVFADQDYYQDNYTYQEAEEEQEAVVNSQDLPIVKFLQDAYSIQDITNVSTVWDNCSDKSDVIVTLYLSRISNVSPIEINMLRRKGLHWNDIVGRLDISPRDILPQFNSCPVSDQQRDHVMQIVTLQNWLKNRDKYPLYDKTLRHLCTANLLVDFKNYTPIKAAQAVQIELDPINTVYRFFVEKD